MLTVEVIEDDVAMRTLLSEWLEDEGHAVTARARLADRFREAVDLVVIDLPQPHDDDAVARVRATHPGAAVIGISARLSGAAAGHSHRADALGVQRLVPKPCTRRELLDAVAGAMADAR